MEHTQKMFLVPQNQLATLQPPQTTDSSNVSLRQSVQSELDRAMSEILKQPDINVYEKAKKYSSILQRYLALARQGEREKSVITLSLPDESSKDDASMSESQDAIAQDDMIRAEVLAHMPSRNKRNAEYIITSLSRNNKIAWSNNGEIVVEDKPVPGSHLYDLLKSVTTHNNVSDRSRPKGWNIFLKTLASLNVPLSVIPNTMVRRSIEAFKTGERDETNTQSSMSDLRTPRMRREIRMAPSFIHSTSSDLRATSTPRPISITPAITKTRWASF